MGLWGRWGVGKRGAYSARGDPGGDVLGQDGGRESESGGCVLHDGLRLGSRGLEAAKASQGW